ncbi:MAG TPA: cytochrome B6 [Chloroflexi bacterium]|nr:cytochrome B6 [Chloroflexota bacterium]
MTQSLTRRELLSYVWLSSAGVFLAEISGVGYFFAMPRFKAGEFGGEFTIPVEMVPPPPAAPQPNQAGKFWLVRTEAGVLALYKVCTHLGCLYDWLLNENYFRCPCHGSQFYRDGRLKRLPAPRGLDRFVIRALDAAGTVLAETPRDGSPILLPPETAAIVVDTGSLIRGQAA